MDFGLGLILSFTDNATAGIERASNSITQLSQIAQRSADSLGSLGQSASLDILARMSDRVGNAFTTMGAKVLGSISGIINSVNSVGSEVFFAQNAFTTLFGSSEKASEEMKKIKDYAAESAINYRDLLSMVRLLKTRGIDAFQQIATKTYEASQGAEGYSQTLMAYASDLASFNPQMKNVYGEGVQAAMGAISEYVAEGNKRLLKTGTSLDITQILGENIGATIEERSKQVANLLEQMNMVGQTELMKGTPTQIISSMEDKLFTFLSKVAQESGVYEKYTGILSQVAELVTDITDADMNAFAKSFGEGINAVLNPLGKLVSTLVKTTKNLMDILKLHPKLMKFVTMGGTLTGVFLVVSGVIFKAVGAFSTFANAISTFAGSSIMTAFTTGFSSLVSTLAPLALLFGSLAVAWGTDFAGIRTDVTGFVANIIESFNNARDIVSLDADSMMQRINLLRNSGDFWSNITIGFSELLVVGQALSELFASEDGFTLSAETFQKLDELGLLPLIERFLDVKARFLEFKDGFIRGFNEMSETVGGFFDSLTEKADGTIFESLLSSLNDFLTKLSGADLGAWNDFGATIGNVAGALLMLAPAIALIKSIFPAIVTGVRLAIGAFNLFEGAFELFLDILFGSERVERVAYSIGQLLGNALKNIGLVLQNSLQEVWQSVLGFFSGLSAPVIAVIAVVLASIFAYAFTCWDDFRAQIDSLVGNFTEGLNAIIESVAPAFQQIWDALSGVGAPIIESAIGLWNTLKESISAIIDTIVNSTAFQMVVLYLSAIGEVIMGIAVPQLNTLWNMFVSAFTAMMDISATVVSSIINVIGSFVTTIMDIVSGILNIITGLITGDGDLILQGITTILNSIGSFITTFISSGLNIVNSLIKGGVSFIVTTFTGIVSNITGALNTILSTFSRVLGTIYSTVSEKFNLVGTTIGGIMDTAVSAVQSAIEKIKSFFSGEFPIPKIKLPHFKISGKLSLDPPQIPSISVDWYAQGGVFNRPRIIGVGENGAEAVMPLENNLGWIDTLANEIGNRMRVVPTANNYYSEQPLVSGSTYNNYSSTTTAPANNIDNSVVFNSGAIVVNVANASMEEAERFAQIVMEKIQRKTQVDRVMNYKSLNAPDNEFIF